MVWWSKTLRCAAMALVVVVLLGCGGGDEAAGPSAPAGGGGGNGGGASDGETYLPPFTGGEARIGDAGLKPVKEQHAEYFPQQKEWTQAGVRGGIPMQLPVAANVPLDGDIQKAIDSASPGVVQLAAGEYTLSQPLNLRNGVVLRGNAKGTTLRFDGGESSPGIAIVLRDVETAGVEQLRLVYADPQGYAEGKQRDPGIYANAPGFKPTGDAAITLANATDCWVSSIHIERALSHPLKVTDSKHCTVRDVRVDDVLNRGNLAGAFILESSHHLLVSGLKLRGLRYIEVGGPLEWSVIRSVISSAGIYFRDADRIRGILIEDGRLLSRPGHPFGPLAKGPMPMGPDNMIIDCIAYSQGTDAIAGHLLKPHEPHQFNPYSDRYLYDPATRKYSRMKFLKRAEYTKVIREVPGGDEKVTRIAARWDKPPADVPLMGLHNGALIDGFVWVKGLTGEEALGADLSALLADPLKPGVVRQIAGRDVKPALVEGSEPGGAMKANPANYQQMVGRFGQEAINPGGNAVDLLKASGGDWTAGVVFQRVFHIPGEPVLTMQLRPVGCEVEVFVGETEIKEKRWYQFAPGYHVLTVKAALKKHMALVKNSKIELKFDLEPPVGPVTVTRETPNPSAGFLYPFQAGIDPLKDERAAIDAWDAYFKKLRKAPFADRIATTKKLIADHQGTHVAWLAERILWIFENAPYTEDEKLRPQQWNDLLNYYRIQGLPQREWALKEGKSIQGEDFYPEVVDDIHRWR